MVNGGLYPNSKLSEDVLKKNEAAVTEAAERFMKAVLYYKETKPSFFRMAIFRATHSSMKYSDEALAADRQYYADNGWLESRYYTSVRIGLIKRAFGALIDSIIKGMIKKSK